MEDRPNDKDIHRVHFEVNKDVLDKDNEIVVQKSSGQKFEIHLGFLQLGHKYRITFSVPRAQCHSINDSQSAPECIKSDSQHLNILSASGTSDKLLFHLELFACKEKLMTEEFSFKLSDLKDALFTVVLKARVLGKGKGTPLLKNGIHIIEHPVDSDSSSE